MLPTFCVINGFSFRMCTYLVVRYSYQNISNLLVNTFFCKVTLIEFQRSGLSHIKNIYFGTCFGNIHLPSGSYIQLLVASCSLIRFSVSISLWENLTYYFSQTKQCCFDDAISNLNHLSYKKPMFPLTTVKYVASLSIFYSLEIKMSYLCLNMKLKVKNFF